MVQLGAEFVVPVPDEFKKGPDPAISLLEEIRGVLVDLPRAIDAMTHHALPQPRPYLHVEEPDLSAIVTAVNGLKPQANPAEISREIVKQLNPMVQTDQSYMVEAMEKLIEKIDFRLQGVGRAFGASGPSNISDNPERLLGHVTVDSIPSITGLVGTESTVGPVVGQKTWTSGAAVQLSSTSHPMTNGILVQGLQGNTNLVEVGPAGVTLGDGYQLVAGQATSFTCADINLLYVIGSHSGDGVCWSVE